MVLAAARSTPLPQVPVGSPYTRAV
jgi:hypothetical protein